MLQILSEENTLAVISEKFDFIVPIHIDSNGNSRALSEIEIEPEQQGFHYKYHLQLQYRYYSPHTVHHSLIGYHFYFF